MELKRGHDWRRLVSILYVLAFSVYLIIGLQPVEARNYDISGEVTIPSINLNSAVTTLTLNNNRLDTPDTIVGSYSRNNKIFLIGHSSTVFKNLHLVKLGDVVYYKDKIYKIIGTETLAKSQIDMNEILTPTKQNTLVIMTCAGEDLGGGDATHRLIVTAIEE